MGFKKVRVGDKVGFFCMYGDSLLVVFVGVVINCCCDI